jgi:hypothetical protein
MAEADATEAQDVAEPETRWPVTTIVGALGLIAAVLIAIGFFNQEPWFVLGGFAGVAVTQSYRAVALRLGLPLGRFA